MKVSERFPWHSAPSAFWRFLADPETLAYLRENHPEILDLELVDAHEEDEKSFVKLKYTLEPSLPATLKKALGGAGFSFVVDLVVDRANDTATLEIIPTRLEEMIKAGGRIAFERQEDGWVQRLDGDVTVTVPRVGKMIERLFVERLRSFYGTQLRLREEYLRHAGPAEPPSQGGEGSS